MSLPIVAIVGRPNVGKSTLFNRIVRRREAVVDDLPGVTRDRKYSEAEWAGVKFLLADTGGFIPSSVEGMEARVRHQVEMAIAESDLVVFLTDGAEGPNPVEKEIAARLRKSGRPSLLVVNKIDRAEGESGLSEFYQLGLSDPVPVSAAQGLGMGDFLDILVSKIPRTPVREISPGIRIAVVGRPNVGKSSFVNGLINEDRLIVDEKPGTTRDSIDTTLNFEGKKLVLIDTAGLRKRSRIKESVEYFCTIRSLRSIQRCDVAILITDASEGLTRQDKRIAVSSRDYGKCLVIVANKSDLLTKEGKRDLLGAYRRQLPFVSYAPIVLTSALLGMGLAKALEYAVASVCEAKKMVEKEKLVVAIERAVEASRPPAYGDKWVRISACEQKGVSPPRFVLFSNHPKGLKKDYLRYLEKRIRDEFGFVGTPMRFSVAARK
ncbi:MAG: ribosome biogenesis GTPase Der [bacterium]